MLEIFINNNEEAALKILKKVKDNDGYCPCRIKKIPDNKCMCKEFREKTDEGYCHCGLYKKVNVQTENKINE